MAQERLRCFLLILLAIGSAVVISYFASHRLSMVLSRSSSLATCGCQSLRTMVICLALTLTSVAGCCGTWLTSLRVTSMGTHEGIDSDLCDLSANASRQTWAVYYIQGNGTNVVRDACSSGQTWAAYYIQGSGTNVARVARTSLLTWAAYYIQGSGTNLERGVQDMSAIVSRQTWAVYYIQGNGTNVVRDTCNSDLGRLLYPR